ncbi:glutathione S-transferase [Roseobacter sp. YSTF-M11]|uniref:Glutathione S-transferase n=1 Tax=Roseobacter insulae TaxID=2859783 RepID=A0A9X1FUK8_9RHOB|nr:glutathione S-transferase [Roseobacter insulae]MBW4708215.1 glutathione S-transferase [Roseobacter insulae]
MPAPVRIHRFAKSGHSHRVELFASLIGIDYELIDVDLANGAHKAEPFLSLNPAGQVPVLEDGDTVITDSNAILVYLARKYAPDWLPASPVMEAQVQRFLSLAAGEIANGPAAARLITVFGAALDADRCKAVATIALNRLEQHLQNREWLVGARPSIADVAIYSYTAHAPEGNISLEEYPNVRALLTRIEHLKGFVPMPATKAGLAA